MVFTQRNLVEDFLQAKCNFTRKTAVLRFAESLEANVDRKSAISPQRGQLDPKFQAEGVAATNHSLLNYS